MGVNCSFRVKTGRQKGVVCVFIIIFILLMKSVVVLKNSINPGYFFLNANLDDSPSAFDTIKPKAFVCGYNVGRLGNQLFQLASGYGIAYTKNMTYVMNKNSVLNTIFNLGNDSYLLISNHSKSICNVTKYRHESMCCGYDKNVLNFPSNMTYNVFTYLQSWKYFDEASANLRKQLTFKKNISEWVKKTITNVSKIFKFKSRSDVTLVGVHVRRGDMTTKWSYGHLVATSDYLHKAFNFFSNFTNVIYVVCSTDIEWVIKNIPQHNKNVYIHSPNKYPEKDLALLASCDHVITTVGTFSWWAGWFSNGIVIYYKWPARKNSPLRENFSRDFMDFFYPQWIGM